MFGNLCENACRKKQMRYNEYIEVQYIR